MKCFSFCVSGDIPPMAQATIQRKAAEAARGIFQQEKRRVFVFLRKVSEKEVSGCVLLNSGIYQDRETGGYVRAFLMALSLTNDELLVSVISEEAACDALFAAFRANLIDDVDGVLDAFGSLRLRREVGEVHAVKRNASRHALQKSAEEFPVLPELARELERIQLSSKHPPCAGHPVHYAICLEQGQDHEEVVNILLSSLYACRRIQRAHYVALRVQPYQCLNEEALDGIMASAAGGAVVFDLIADDPVEDDKPFALEDNVRELCHAISSCGKRVLSVICCPPSRETVLRMIRESTPGIDFLLMKQEGLEAEPAREHLQRLAISAGAQPDAALYKDIDMRQQKIPIKDLHDAFDAWYNGYLRREVYPQYEQVPCLADEMMQESREQQPDCNAGRAYAKLLSMVGLADAKRTMEQVLASHRARNIFESHGIRSQVKPMHMLFTGNPGTAKTSVARLYAQILKEQGVLRCGELIEVGRSDLVGRFVGSTARLVKEWFKKAKGSVLFIDEAYALATGNAGSFGQEAIDTLVMEMENRREDTLVILAGYPDKMEELLQLNPGLRSRIGFHIAFEDYSSEELMQILLLLAKEQGVCLEPGVTDSLMPRLSKARKNPEFGNGCYVRNLLDKARMNHAERLLRLSSEQLEAGMVQTLVAEDFIVPDLLSKPAVKIDFH